jgi:hypothetical protein
MMSFFCTTTHLVQQQTVLFEIVKYGENSLLKPPSLVIYFEPHPMLIKLKLGLHIGGKQLLADHMDQSYLLHSSLASDKLCCAFYHP